MSLEPQKKKSAPVLIRTTVLLCAGILCTWLTLSLSNRELRADLLQTTRFLTQEVNVERVAALTGTESDLENPYYLQLKEQLSAVRSANPQCRFVYLMGRKTDGAFFFFVDSEPATSRDYSPPGQAYGDDPTGLNQVFDTTTGVVEGPVTDRWGTWISSLIPITDPQSGVVIAALGMDIDARDWSWEVAAAAALPASLMLVLFAGVGIFSARRFDASTKPVLRSFLPPLAALLTLLVAGAGTLLWKQYRHQLTSQITDEIYDSLGDFRSTLDLESRGLAAAILPIAADPGVRQALRNGCADGLLEAWRPFFDTQNKRNHLTHFYFSDKNRVCLLRIHKPDRKGDRLDRFTIREAERTHKTSSGLELGPLGTLTLRVVEPVFDDGQVIGYVELGKEIEDVLRMLNTQSGVQQAVVINKGRLTRPAWEEGMRMLGRPGDWDRLPQSILISAPHGRMTEAFASWAEQATKDLIVGKADREISFDRKDWWVSSVPLEDAAGERIGHLQTMLDVTAQKVAFAHLMAIGGTTGAVLMTLLLGFAYVLLHRTDLGIRAQQLALRESEERYRTLFDRANYGIVLLAGDGKLISVNESMARMHGYRTDEMLTMSMTDLDTPQSYHGVEERLRRLRSGEEFSFEAEHHHKDGHVFPVEVSVSRITIAGDSVIQGFHRDITERKQAEEALRKSERKYRELVEHANSIILHWTRDGRITFLNEYGQKFFGYTEAEIVGKHVMDTLVPESDSGGRDLRPLMDEICSNPLAFAHNINENTLRNGNKVWIAWTNKVDFDEHGQVAGVLSIGTDITERKRAEAEKEKLEAQLQRAQRLEAVGQLAGGVAHDFNNLLQVILGYTALELDRLGTDAESGDALKEIHKAAVRAADLTRQLLTFSRRQIIQPIDLNLNDLIENALKMIRRVIGEHIELRFTSSESLWTVHVDKGQLEQVLMNLCVNARDAMNNGGSLCIKTENVVVDDEYCRANPEATKGPYVLLSVTDTGHGMDEETCAQIFEPFFTTKGLGQGTGLGLATVYGIVKQHNGLIHVESAPGEGTVFKVYIPSVERPASVEREAQREAPIGGGSETILVAEDEEGVRNLICHLLKAEGYTVISAYDGEDALRVFDRHAGTIDLAILDVMMPKLGGREVMDYIQARRAHVRFLFSSGYSESAVHTDFVVHNGLHLITKPYQKAILLRAVRDILDAPRSV